MFTDVEAYKDSVKVVSQIQFDRSVAGSYLTNVSFRSASISRRWSIFMEGLGPQSVPATCLRRAHMSIRALLPSGKAPMALVRRLISHSSRSSVLFVRIRVQCWLGKSINVSVSSILSLTFLPQPEVSFSGVFRLPGLLFLGGLSYFPGHEWPSASWQPNGLCHGERLKRRCGKSGRYNAGISRLEKLH